MIRRLISRLAILAVIATTLATVGAFGARASWLLELCSHFPVQYLAVQMVAAPLCLWLRQWFWASVAVLAVIPNVLVIAPYVPELASSPDAVVVATMRRTSPVRLIAANLDYSQKDNTAARSAARAYLGRHSADLLVLSEFTQAWRESLSELEQSYPYFTVRPRWNPWGIAVYSKYPIQAIEDLNLGDSVSSHLRILVQLPGGLAEVYAVHFISPTSPRRAKQRNTQLRMLAKRLAAADPALPKIVAGDFNSTPYSPYFVELLREGGLRDESGRFGLVATWPTWFVPPWIRIDHCLVSGAVIVSRVAVGPRIGSDHLPLECSFSLQAQSSIRKLRN